MPKTHTLRLLRAASGLAVGVATAAWLTKFLWRRWRPRRRPTPPEPAALRAERLRSEVSQLHERIQAHGRAWKAQQSEMQERLEKRSDELHLALMAMVQSSDSSAPSDGGNTGGTYQFVLGRRSCEVQVSYDDRDRLVDRIQERCPELAQLDGGELSQRAAVFDAKGFLIPFGARLLPEEAYPLLARYSEPQVRVANPRLRGVTFSDLLDFFESHCGGIAYEDKNGMLPVCMPTKLARLCNRRNVHATQMKYDRVLPELQPNMYAVDLLLIRTLTEPDRVSASELFRSEGAPVDTFVSHYWGQDFGEFVQSLYRFILRHRKTVCGPCSEQEFLQKVRQTVLFICAFSNNQWNLITEMGSNIEDSPFYKVLKAPTTTKLVMNLDHMAASLQRAWCDFEFYLGSVLQKDIVLNCRFGPLERLGSSSDENKIEELWMLHVFELLQDVDFRLAQASKAKDLVLINDEIKSFVGTGIAQGREGGEALNFLIKSMIASEVLPALARIGDLAALEQALDNGADVETTDHRHIRPLTYAAATHGPDSQVARLLLGHGACPLAADHAERVVQLFSEESAVRKSSLLAIQALLTPEQNRFHRRTIKLAKQQHMEHYRQLLRALSQFQDEEPPASVAVSAAASTPDPRTPTEAAPAPTSITLTPMLDRSAEQLAGPASPPKSGLLSQCASSSLQAQSRSRSRSGDNLSNQSQRTPHEAKLMVIAEGLEDSDSLMRAAACELLGEAGTDAAEHAPKLVECLQDDDEAVRIAALAALAQVGPEQLEGEHVDTILGCLDDSDHEVREAACEALGTLGAQGEQAAISASLVGLMEDAHVEVRVAAIGALSQLAPEASTAEAAAVIAEQLDATKPEEVRIAAISALGQLNEATSYLPTIAGCLDNDEWRVREAACEAIAEAGELATAHVPEIVELLQDGDADVRGAACTALAQIGSGAAEPASAVAGCLTDDAPEVRTAAVAALAQMGDAGAVRASQLVDSLADQCTEVRRLACEALSQVGGTAAASALGACLLDPDEGVRETASQALVDMAGAAPAMVRVNSGRTSSKGTERGGPL